MRMILIALAMMLSASAYAQQSRYVAPTAEKMQVCIDAGNMANRILHDRFHTNNIEASMKTLHGLQGRLTEIGGAEAANLMVGTMLEFLVDAYRIPYTSNQAQQQVIAEKFIRERVEKCVSLITTE